MLSNLISRQRTISMVGCLLQMHFFHSLGNSEEILLTTMAIDSYLQGPASLAFLCCSQRLHGFPHCPSVDPTKSTRSSVILNRVLRLACTDTSMILIEDVIHAVAIIFSVLVIALSYITIITVILRIPSVEGRQKAFSTYAAHLGVFLMFYGSVSLMYLRFSVTFPPILDTAIALMFAVLAPFFNPIIYSFRTKDIKIAVKKLFCPQKTVIFRSMLAHRHLSLWMLL
ncbi:hypothetical protein H8959_017343 [Pygathrix nigripes]